MKKIVITGVAGFIGSNLCERILKDPDIQVIGIDNLSYGRLENLSGFIDNSNFQFYNADITDLSQFPDLRDCSTLFHFAAKKIPRYGGVQDVLKTNLISSISLFDHFIKFGTNIIFASTADIYGKNINLPFKESSDSVFGSTDVPRWTYASSKFVCEQYLSDMCKTNDINATALRFFGGYGPHMGPDWQAGPIPVMYKNSKEQKALPIHGTGLQTRSFTYVQDYVDFIIRTFETNQKGFHSYNVGNNQEITIIELAKKIWDIVNPGLEVVIEKIPYESFGKYEDVKRRLPDLSKSINEIGVKSKIGIDDGLALTISWLDSIYER